MNTVDAVCEQCKRRFDWLSGTLRLCPRCHNEFKERLVVSVRGLETPLLSLINGKVSDANGKHPKE